MLPIQDFVHGKHVDTVVHELLVMASSLAATIMSKRFLSRQGRAGQGRAGQGRAGQGRAGRGVSPDATGHGFNICRCYMCANVL